MSILELIFMLIYVAMILPVVLNIELTKANDLFKAEVNNEESLRYLLNLSKELIAGQSNKEQKNDTFCLNGECLKISTSLPMDSKLSLIKYTKDEIIDFVFINSKRDQNQEQGIEDSNTYDSKINNNDQSDIYYNTLKTFTYLLIVTKSKILLYDIDKEMILDEYSFDFVVKLVSYEFINTDNNIVLLSEDGKVFNFSIYISNNKTSKASKNISIPIKKEIFTDLKHIISIKQIKLHSNKYYILSDITGNVYVLNNIFEIRTKFFYSSTITSTLAENGLLGIVKDKEVFFTNILGGNSLVVKCFSNSEIHHVIYDLSSSLLFMLNANGQLVVYTAKISLSKTNTNECNEIYSYQFSKYTDKHSFLVLSNQTLYIQPNEGEVFIINLRNLQSNGSFAIDRIHIMKSLVKDDYSDEFIINNLGIHYSKNYESKKLMTYMVSQISKHHLILNKYSLKKAAVEKKTKSDSGSGPGYTFIVNIVLIISITIIIYYYRAYSTKSNPKVKKYEEDTFKYNDQDISEAIKNLNRKSNN